MSARRKRVQVGWYCNHEHEPLGERTHMSNHGKSRKGKWVETFPEPNTYQSLTFLDYRDPKKRPACASMVPIYIYVDQPAVSQ